MTRLTTLMLLAVKHFCAIEIARMIINDRWGSKLAANFITKMLSTASFLFANGFTFERLFLFLPALNFPCLKSTITALFNHHLALRTTAFMTTSRASMSTIMLFTTRHSAHWYNLSTWFSIIRISSQHFNFIFTTRTSLLKGWCFSAAVAISYMTFLLATVKFAVE